MHGQTTSSPRQSLTHIPAQNVSAETLADEITELSAHIDAATYRLLVLIERFDRSEGWAEIGVRSCAHWLGWKCGLGAGAARERVRVAAYRKYKPPFSTITRIPGRPNPQPFRPQSSPNPS